MKDLAREIILSEIDIPKIHGEVDIRLKNPMTGRIVKQVKGENTFMSSNIAKGLRDLGSAMASYYVTNGSGTNATYEPWKDIVGGIFLFRDSLSNAQYMPKGNRMQANGSFDVTNNSNPPELGSWNGNESSATQGSLLMVYDWTTSQANGAGGISSVALTSRVGGYIGYGNPSETCTPTLKSFSDRVSLKKIQGINNVDYSQKIQTNNKCYQFSYDSNTKKISVQKSRVPLSQGSVFDWIVTSSDTVEIDVSSLHYSDVAANAGGMNATLSDGDIYLMGSTAYGTTVAVSGKFYVWKYNPSDDSISEIAVTNTSSATIIWNAIGVSHGNIYVHSGANSKTYVFAISDSDYKGYIENLSTGLSMYATGTDFPGGLVYIPYDAAPSGVNGIPGRFYDDTNNTAFPTNGTFGVTNMRGNLYYDAATDSLNYYERTGAWAFNNPLYLATNYNLPSAVTKDNTMTMQVRYTLTEA